VLSDQARELRQQGIAAAKAGQKDQARQLLQQSIRLEPNSEAAWLWLASVARDQRERVFCLQKILEINPNNETALRALEGVNTTDTPATAAPSAQRTTGESATAREQDVMNQPPGVPLPSSERVAEAQKQADALLRGYMMPLPSDVKWVHKNRRRAGEGDIIVLRLYVTAAVIGLLIVLGVVGTIVVLTNDDLRSLVLAPTGTATHTPTVTSTFTPGFTPTPSATPRVSPTPSATVAPSVPTSNPYVPPQATSIYPPVLEKPIEDSISLIDRGQASVALPTLRAERNLTENRFNPIPYYYEALAQVAEGNTDAALDIMDEAEGRLDETPNDNFAPLVDTGFAHIYWQLAQDAFSEGDNASALDYLNEMQDRAESALEGDPRLADPYILLARFHALGEDYDQAIDILDQGLQVQQLANNVSLIIEKGNVYFQQGEYDLVNYQAFLALYIDPTTEVAYQLRVRTALADDNPGQAVLNAQEYLHYYPGSPYAYKLLGDARIAEGNIDEAIIAYSRGLTGDTNPETLESLLVRGTLYMQQGRYDLARADFTDAYELTDDPEILVMRMQAALHEGRYQIALDDADALDGSGVVLQGEIDFVRARALVDQADEGDAAALQQAVNLLVSLPGREGIPPEMLPLVYEYTSRAYLALGNEAAALQAIDSALATVETGSGHFIRGQILEAQGENDEAVREYEWVLTWSQIYPFPFRGDAEAALEELSNT
jgi:tetratricopeptide (TPR) repeat protein